MPETGNVQPQAQKPTAAALQAKFEQGVALHQQGRLAEAERIYREVLQRQPNHSGALHLLGAIALQTEHTERAVELIGKAIALKPDYAEAHYNRGLALLDLKRPEEALANYDRAIALQPDYAEAHNNRGNALSNLKRPAQALASYDIAIAR
jgi:Tfp pilus assembly protein PilF